MATFIAASDGTHSNGVLCRREPTYDEGRYFSSQPEKYCVC